MTLTQYYFRHSGYLDPAHTESVAASFTPSYQQMVRPQERTAFPRLRSIKRVAARTVTRTTHRFLSCSASQRNATKKWGLMWKVVTSRHRAHELVHLELIPLRSTNPLSSNSRTSQRILPSPLRMSCSPKPTNRPVDCPLVLLPLAQILEVVNSSILARSVIMTFNNDHLLNIF